MRTGRKRNEAITVGVIGLGYVGLRLAVTAADAGYQVIGFDTDSTVVAALQRGHSHIGDVTDDLLGRLTESEALTVSDDGADLAGADVFVVCVPTPLSADGAPDLTYVLAAADQLAGVLRPGCTVVLESSTYPGTTEGVFREHLEQGGAKAGTDFALAYSPERVDPGNPRFDVANTPKVVGGLTPECAEAAAAFYRKIVNQVVIAKGLREAELAKLLENTYRHVNIALVNEMAKFSHELGIDLWDAMACAATKPFGFESFAPGPGVGGHCIPIDPRYLSHTVRARLGYPFQLVELAEDINASMPAYVAARAQRLLNDAGKAVRGARILLLGVTYKADVADQRETPALPLAALLANEGATVRYHDPYVATWSVEVADAPSLHLASEPDLAAAVRDSDVVVLLQAHRVYLDAQVLREALDQGGTPLLDTRGRLDLPGVQRL